MPATYIHVRVLGAILEARGIKTTAERLAWVSQQLSRPIKRPADIETSDIQRLLDAAKRIDQ